MERRVPSTISQPVAASLTRAAIFLVVTVNDGPDHEAAVRGLCGDLAGLLRAIGFRDLDGRLFRRHARTQHDQIGTFEGVDPMSTEFQLDTPFGERSRFVAMASAVTWQCSS
jgi:hypothetical protein